MATKQQITTNRRNGKKGTGPDNTDSTRWNALRNGLNAKGLTELDDLTAYERILADLTLRTKPVGPLEEGLVRFAALDMTKWHTAQVLEAQYITGVLHPATFEKNADTDLTLQLCGRMLDPGFRATFSVGASEYLVLYQRYASSHSNRFYRTLHELERIQRLRKGEYVPAPCAVDVSVHSGVEVKGESNAQATDASNLPTTTINVDDKQVATAAESEQQEVPCNGGNPAINVSVSDGSDRNPGMSSSAPQALWQKAKPRPVWH